MHLRRGWIWIWSIRTSRRRCTIDECFLIGVDKVVQASESLSERPCSGGAGTPACEDEKRNRFGFLKHEGAQARLSPSEPVSFEPDGRATRK
jgi:hypothetical protein